MKKRANSLKSELGPFKLNSWPTVYMFSKSSAYLWCNAMKIGCAAVSSVEACYNLRVHYSAFCMFGLCQGPKTIWDFVPGKCQFNIEPIEEEWYILKDGCHVYQTGEKWKFIWYKVSFISSSSIFNNCAFLHCLIAAGALFFCKRRQFVIIKIQIYR